MDASFERFKECIVEISSDIVSNAVKKMRLINLVTRAFDSVGVYGEKTGFLLKRGYATREISIKDLYENEYTEPFFMPKIRYGKVTLYLNSCWLTNLDGLSEVAGLEGVQVLYLNENVIEFIKPFTFAHLPNLEKLYLYRNCINFNQQVFLSTRKFQMVGTAMAFAGLAALKYGHSVTHFVDKVVDQCPMATGSILALLPLRWLLDKVRYASGYPVGISHLYKDLSTYISFNEKVVGLGLTMLAGGAILKSNNIPLTFGTLLTASYSMALATLFVSRKTKSVENYYHTSRCSQIVRDIRKGLPANCEVLF